MQPMVRKTRIPYILAKTYFSLSAAEEGGTQATSADAKPAERTKGPAPKPAERATQPTEKVEPATSSTSAPSNTIHS